MGIAIHHLAADGDLSPFLSLPAEVYRNDPHYSARPETAAVAGLRRPDFIDRQRIFVATDGDKARTRVVARLSPSLTNAAGKPYGMLGFFEAHNDPATVEALFAEAADWLRAGGGGDVIGPMDGDTWHAYRLNIGPYEERPFLMEPYNPSYYPDLWQRAGFTPLEEYSSTTIDDPAAAAAGLAKAAERATRRGYRLRPFRMDQFAAELKCLYRLSTRIFAANFLYTPISLADFISLYDGVERLLDPELIWFLQSPDGDDIGFVFALPDNFHAVRALRGRRNLASLARFWWLKGRTDAMNIKTLGIVPEYQGTGTALLLMHRIYELAERKGYRRVNLCLIREGNASGRMDGGQSRLLRRYRIYHRRVDGA